MIVGVASDRSGFALLTVYAATAGLALWQASNHPSPTIFTDEIEMTQLARSLAETGHATLRGQSIHGLVPLAAYLSAPFWWINDVPTAYSLIKAFGALIMAAAVSSRLRARAARRRTSLGALRRGRDGALAGARLRADPRQGTDRISGRDARTAS